MLSWNIHCSDGTNSTKQALIAEAITKADADIIQLNEYYVDKCFVIDSILRQEYQFSHLRDSHEQCGNAIYSKLKLDKQGSLYTIVEGKYASMMSVVISIKQKRINVIGVHLPSNNEDESLVGDSISSLLRIYPLYKNYKNRQVYRSSMEQLCK